MTIKHALIALSALVASSSAVMAQPPQGGPPGGGHGGGGPGGNPIMGALDPDHNHELSAEEIKNASKALLALDKNGDGKLTEEDLGQMGPRGGGRPSGGPGGGGPPGGGQGMGGPGGGGSEANQSDRVSDFSSRLLAFDKNDNGKIEKDELPDRMQRVLDRVDKNKDDVIDESELNALKSTATEDSRGGASGRRGRNGAQNERRRRGREGGDGGPGGMRGGPPGGGGGMDRMIEHAFEFDKDGDGKLTREELMEFAKNMPQPGGGGPGMGGPPGGSGGPGGRGGPPRGGRQR